MQTIPDEQSVVWFQRMISVGAAGGYTAGQVIADPRNLDSVGDGNLGEQTKTVKTATVAGTTSYTVNLPAPLREYGLEIYLVGGQIHGKDDGKGAILGVGMQGTVNYATGVLTLDFIADPGDSEFTVLAQIDTDNKDTSIDVITNKLEAFSVKARIHALAADFGVFSAMAFSNRFGGGSGEDTVAETLSRELAHSKNTRAIQALHAAAVGNTNWNSTAPSGVSYAEHKLTFADAFADAESIIHQNGGGTSIDATIAGRTAAAKLRAMPEFVVNGTQVQGASVSLYGSYDGVPVIRATNVIPDAEAVVLSRGDSYFTAPLVHGSYMPLIETSTVSDVQNPFHSRKAAGEWSSLDVVVPGLISKITITS
jgi:hypothetical protein